MKKLSLLIVLALIIQSNISSQPCLQDGITFSSQAQIDNFQTNYPDCTEIEGDVEFNGNDITNLNGLNVVTSIGGDISIGDSIYPYNSNPLLPSLIGLENMISIGGDLSIFSNDALTNLTGLENLTSIGGSLKININNSLTSLSGLDNLTSINGGLYIGIIGWAGPWGGNPSLTSLTGLDNLTSIGGHLLIEYNAAMTSLTGLDSVTSIGGNLSIAGNDSLTSLTGLGNVSSIGGSLEIGIYYPGTPPSTHIIIGNLSLINLTGLDNVTSIGGRLSIANNNSLTSLTGLGNLTSIGGSLEIGSDLGNDGLYGNPCLINLTGLDNVTSIGGRLKIVHNNALISLTGLDNMTSIGGDLWITNNASLSSCEVQSICEYLINPNGNIEIHDNAPGCNNQEEVDSACVSVSVKEINLSDKLIIYPNPSTSQITIELLDALKKNAVLTIYNMNSQLVFSGKITSQKTEVDISGLPIGIYFIKVADKKTMSIGKLVKN